MLNIYIYVVALHNTRAHMYKNNTLSCTFISMQLTFVHSLIRLGVISFLIAFKRQCIVFSPSKKKKPINSKQNEKYILNANLIYKNVERILLVQLIIQFYAN